MKMTFGWIDPGTRWLAGMDMPKAQETWQQDAVQNEWLMNQCVLQTTETAVATLGTNMTIDWAARHPRIRIEANVISAPTGHENVPLQVQLRWIGRTPDNEGALRADPVLSAEFITVTADQPVAFCVLTHVPKGARPGDYVVELSLFRQTGWDTEERVQQIRLQTHVHPVSLPDPADYTFHLDLWQHPTRWAQYYDIPRWSDDHFAIIEAQAEELATRGQKAITVIASDAPWAGQNCRHDIDYPLHFYEFNMIGVRRETDGSIVCDFSVMDRYIRTFERHGIDAEIEIYGLLGAWHDDFGTPLIDYPDPIRIRCYDVQHKRYGFLTTRAELHSYVASLIAHLRRQGWFDKTRIASDEPADEERFSACLDFLKSIDPDIRFKIACNHASFIEAFQDRVLDWVPSVYVLADDASVTQKLIESIRARGGRMSWYVCCSPAYPNTFIRSPLLETRLMGWLTAWFGLDGFLRWAFSAWPEDVWNRPAWRFLAGDLFFVYPGRNGRPVSSLRWEMLRLAIQDYELLHLVRNAIANVTTDDERVRYRQRLDEIMQSVIRVESLDEFVVETKSPGELYAQDYETFGQARKSLIELLAELNT